jgi:aminopeptidase N
MKKGVALTIAHELSHQWFGDLVTMEWWDDLWLNESFASVMEYYAVDAIYPDYKIFESFFTGDCCSALIRDAYTGVQSVHQDVNDPEEIATLFDGAIVYAKGARLMLMLIRAMGWTEFCKGIHDYFEKAPLE